MEHVEFTHTVGMDREAAEERLRETETGVLSLADGDEAYAVPLAHHYEGGDSVFFRLGVQEGSEKVAFLESTDRACYVVYGYESAEDSWSVMVRGTVHPVSSGDERFDVAEVNRQYPAIQIFDEDVEDLEIRLFELRADAVTGRVTVED
jgi:nitroimidazol reductase NimA-like FMN-containing flavoprotein (pyridoxamine 5'-phosphate oxidase superfamily)